MKNNVLRASPLLIYMWKSYDQLPEACFVAYQQYFSESEKQRIKNIRSKKRWREYIAGHHLIRTMLMSLTQDDVSSEVVEHLLGEPPRFRGLPLDLHVNISHSSGLIVCVLSRVGRVGIDIECPKRTSVIGSIANAYFSRNEIELLNSCEEQQKSAEFYRLWTLKESLMKATQEGISKKGMQTEFSPWAPALPPSPWYSYSFAYDLHYGALTLPYLLQGDIEISIYHSDMKYEGDIHFPLFVHVPN